MLQLKTFKNHHHQPQSRCFNKSKLCHQDMLQVEHAISYKTQQAAPLWTSYMDWNTLYEPKGQAMMNRPIFTLRDPERTR